MQRMAPITTGQTGQDPSSGSQQTLNGNINALFLWNNAGKDVKFSADNSVALNAIAKK